MDTARTLTVDDRLGTVAVHLTEPDRQVSDALLLLHANPGDHRDFDAMVPRFAQQWAVAAVDWPGFGASTARDPAALTVSSLVSVAERVVDTLIAQGFARISVLGNSVGGYVAARLAQQRPHDIAAAVLVQPAGFTGSTPLTRAVCRFMGNHTVARYAIVPSARAYLGPRRNPTQQGTFARATQVPRQPQQFAAYCALWRSLADPRCDLTTAGPILSDTPVQVVWGTRDPINPWILNRKGVARALPNAELATVPTRHEPFSEDPDLFGDTVLPFLTRCGR